MAQVMICDDDVDVLKMMSTIMASVGHRVTTCASGSEALKRLGIQPEDSAVELPDLLVLDIMMPRTDGYSVGTVIRSHPRTRAIPILVVSALREMSQLFSRTVQVDGFLTKPFAPEDLIGSVAKIVEKRQAQA